MGKLVRVHTDLEVYQKAFAAQRDIFELSKSFPRGEIYSLTSQIRRSSRSVCANLAEAWRKRRYEKMFISKLSDADGEAAETQVWLEIALDCGYIQREDAVALYHTYDEIVSTLVGMMNHADKWILPDGKRNSMKDNQ